MSAFQVTQGHFTIGYLTVACLGIRWTRYIPRI